MSALNIGQVARRAGMGIDAIRYYERRGLIEEPARKASGYRQYTEEVIARLRFIKRAKELGFSLDEIKELLSLKLDPASSSSRVKQHAEAKIAAIEEKVRTLQRMKHALEKLSAACSGCGPTGDCPILDALDASEET
ncbi:MAG: heavy metal-responsive transcriptional regulator [Acidobacteriota bacterium]